MSSENNNAAAAKAAVSVSCISGSHSDSIYSHPDDDHDINFPLNTSHVSGRIPFRLGLLLKTHTIFQVPFHNGSNISTTILDIDIIPPCYQVPTAGSPSHPVVQGAPIVEVLAFAHLNSDDDESVDFMNVLPVVSPLINEKHYLLLCFVHHNSHVPSLAQLTAWCNTAIDSDIDEVFKATFGGNHVYFECVQEPTGGHHWNPYPHLVVSIALNCQMIYDISSNAEKDLEKRSEFTINIAINVVYKFLHKNGNKRHGANGSSAYCEITPVCVEKVYTTLSKLNWLKGNGDGITMADLGPGYMVPPNPFSPTISIGNSCGCIGLCALQAYRYATAMNNLLNSNLTYLTLRLAMSSVISDICRIPIGPTLCTCSMKLSQQSQTQKFGDLLHCTLLFGGLLLVSHYFFLVQPSS
jgi:hypothetical protein